MNTQTFEEQLAWYANGTLDEAEQAEMEAWLAAHPEARQRLAEIDFLQGTVAEVTADEPQLDPGGFDLLMAQIDAQEQELELEVVETSVAPGLTEQPEPVWTGRAEKPGLTQQLREWFEGTFQWSLTPAFARVAVVAQFALVAVLGTALYLPQEEAGYEVLSGETGAVTAIEGAVLVDLGLNPTMTLAELQMLLLTHRASIVGGPNSLGIYRIQLADAEPLTALRAHSGVIYLQRIEP